MASALLSFRTRLRSLPAACLLASGLSMLSLHADVVSGTSAGTPLTLNVTSTARLSATSFPVSATTSVLATTPLATASGNAPNPYSVTGSPLTYNAPTLTAGINGSVPGVAAISSGLNTLAISGTTLTNSASSTVTGGPGNQTTTATAGMTGLNLGFGALNASVTLPLSAPVTVNTTLLSITTGVITSTSSVQGLGNGTPMDGTFSSSVANFNISLLGVSILSLAPASLVVDLQQGNPVNTFITLDGVSISLPAGVSSVVASGTIQISNSGSAVDGILSSSASATALTIGFQNVNVSAVVNGTLTAQTSVNGIVTAANTAALQAAVPEPSTMLLSIGALTALVVMRRRRRFV